MQKATDAVIDDACTVFDDGAVLLFGELSSWLLTTRVARVRGRVRARERERENLNLNLNLLKFSAKDSRSKIASAVQKVIQSQKVKRAGFNPHVRKRKVYIKEKREVK